MGQERDGARTHVLVPAERLIRWFDNFQTRHGSYTVTTQSGLLVAEAADGARAEAALPFGRAFSGSTVHDLLAEAKAPITWGLLLVRKGGFAVAAGTTSAPTSTKVGRRHVQGRTKAGGWSQQRFARRRDNQAREAFEAAADHAHRLLSDVEVLVCGGDRAAVEAVLADPRLQQLAARRAGPWLAVPDPSAKVLAQAVEDAWSCPINVTDPSPR